MSVQHNIPIFRRVSIVCTMVNVMLPETRSFSDHGRDTSGTVVDEMISSYIHCALELHSFIRAAVSHYTIISLDYSDVREAHILTYLLFTLKLLIYSQGLQEEPIEASGFTLV